MQPRASGAASARRRSRASNGPSLKKRVKTAIAMAFLIAISLFAIGLVYVVALFLRVRSLVPAVPDIANFQPTVGGTTIYYADNGPDGNPLVMAVLAAENRKPVHLKEISKHVIDATIAVEDSRFYEHRGIDYYGIGRAIFKNVTRGNMRGEGASTITQQLARNLGSLGLSHEKKASRKLAEMLMAVRIEQTYSKEDILNLYLNQIYYGNGAYGVEAAARAYFHRSAGDLSLVQAATLAGMPQRPSVYGVDHEAAKQRRDAVLRRMVETGKITEQECAEAQAKPLRMFKARPRGDQVLGAPYFVDYVRRQLERAYGPDARYLGWKVFTTLDSRIQAHAEECLRRGIRSGEYGATQGCLVSLDPKTGYIRAMVGGIDHDRSEFNNVVQGKGRQPGSAFKPIVYTAAIDRGVCTLDKTYRDDPNFSWRGTSEKWIPKNYNGHYSYRDMTVLDAIRHSINTVAVKVAVDVKVENVISYARRLGITTKLDPYPTIALGTSSVHPLELASAYSVFANDGKRAHPTAITRIDDRNHDTILTNAPEVEDTHLQPDTVKELNTALRAVVTSGTGTAVASVPNACGKTGTTSNSIDAWFAGYTPELVTVIWVAHEIRHRDGSFTYPPMPGATGGHLCAPIWRDFMLKAVPWEQALVRVNTAPPANEVDQEAPEAPVQADQGDEDNQTPKARVPLHDQGGTNDAPTDTGATDQQDNNGNGTDAPATGLGANVTPAAPAPTPRNAPRQTPAAQTGDRLVEPAVPRSDPGDEIVTVRLCAETMRRATEWCPATIERRVRRRDIPGPCREHRPPPGE